MKLPTLRASHLKIVVGQQDDLPSTLQLCLGVGDLRLVVVAPRGRKGNVATLLERKEQVGVESLARACAPAIVGPDRLRRITITHTHTHTHARVRR